MLPAPATATRSSLISRASAARTRHTLPHPTQPHPKHARSLLTLYVCQAIMYKYIHSYYASTNKHLLSVWLHISIEYIRRWYCRVYYSIPGEYVSPMGDRLCSKSPEPAYQWWTTFITIKWLNYTGKIFHFCRSMNCGNSYTPQCLICLYKLKIVRRVYIRN